MKTSIIRWCSLALLSGFLCCQTPAEAQLGGVIGGALKKKKDKGGDDKAEKDKKDKKASKKSYAERIDDLLNFQFNPATPVVNEDWSKGEEIKDAAKLSGDYYMWFPLTNKLEKVFVRWNDYTYKSESKYFPGMQAVVSVWRKESADKPFSKIVLYPYENDMMRSEALMYSNDQGNSNFHYVAIEKDMFVMRLPYYVNGQGKWIKSYYNNNMEPPTPEPDDRIESYEQELVDNESASMFFLVKDKKQLEGFTWEKLVSVLETKYEYSSYRAKSKAAQSGKQAKPKATNSGELYTNKKWFNTAKEGVAKDLAAGKKVVYGYAPAAGWQTINNKATGQPMHQLTTYWFVCERSPEVMKKEAKGKYYLMGGILKRTYNGSGYGEPFYNGFAFADQDLTEAEYQEFLKMAVK